MWDEEFHSGRRNGQGGGDKTAANCCRSRARTPGPISLFGVLLNPAIQQAGDAQLNIIEVAKQEMAHLITVQNLLWLSGQKRPEPRELSPKDPKDYPFPVVLEHCVLMLGEDVTTESPSTTGKG